MYARLNKLIKNGFSIIGTNNIAQLNKVLKYGVSYADATEVLPPVGRPADFLTVHIYRNTVGGKRERARLVAR